MKATAQTRVKAKTFLLDLAVRPVPCRIRRHPPLSVSKSLRRPQPPHGRLPMGHQSGDMLGEGRAACQRTWGTALTAAGLLEDSGGPGRPLFRETPASGGRINLGFTHTS